MLCSSPQPGAHTHKASCGLGPLPNCRPCRLLGGALPPVQPGLGLLGGEPLWHVRQHPPPAGPPAAAHRGHVLVSLCRSLWRPLWQIARQPGQGRVSYSSCYVLWPAAEENTPLPSSGAARRWTNSGPRHTLYPALALAPLCPPARPQAQLCRDVCGRGQAQGRGHLHSLDGRGRGGGPFPAAGAQPARCFPAGGWSPALLWHCLFASLKGRPFSAPSAKLASLPVGGRSEPPPAPMQLPQCSPMPTASPPLCPPARPPAHHPRSPAVRGAHGRHRAAPALLSGLPPVPVELCGRGGRASGGRGL